ncbi:MAG: ABC transporter permease [Deltaproteobacteria bacterium]|nr:MAG: ABC transporter permease [Deltaproteobacteria bacterium]
MSPVRLAARNLFRQPTRSAITLSAILFGMIALMISGGFIEWIFWAMREATVYSKLGHIQIAKAGYFLQAQEEPSAFVIPSNLPELSQLSTIPRVRLVTTRLAFNGLVSHGETTTSFIGEGVEPEKEESVSNLLHITKGNGLSTNDPKGMILGRGLAASLGVDVGDSIILLITLSSGGINAIEGHVRGLFFTVSKEFDDSALRIPIGLAKELLRVSGAHTWIVLLDSTEDTHDVLVQVKNQLQSSKSALEVKPWDELADFYNKTVALYSRQMNALKLIIALIIVLGIANTMTMNVLERTGEIGTLMALGNRSKQIMRLFVTEGLILGLIGGVSGTVIGYILAETISYVGIPMPPAPGMSTGFTGQIRVTPSLAAQALAIAVITSLVASLYPAWKASRLNIVDALRQNR